MRRIRFKVGETLIIVALVVLSATSAMSQPTRAMPSPREFELGRGMERINSDLIQIAVKTDLFLQFAERVNLTGAQQKKLEELFFEIQKYRVRRQADLDVADAELKRLLSNEQVDLAAVRSKVREVESIQADVTFQSIEAVLRAINVLTHAQHLKIMLLVRDLIDNKSLPTPGTEG